jgi:ABC-type transport system involved in multi-copper enzyme maturation permease subunit
MRIFRAEWRKLRRPTLLFGSAGAVIFVTALVTSLLFLLIDSEMGNADRGARITREMLAMYDGIAIGFNSSSGLLGLVALCVFAAQTAQEYTYGTLRNLLLRQPRRIELLLGKYSAMVVFAIITVIVSAVTSVLLAFALASPAEVVTQAWRSSQAFEELAKTFLNVLISTIGYGTIGMILGLLFRSPISAISIGVGWLLVIESILSLAWRPSGDWMPGTLLAIVAAGGSPIGVTDIPSYSQALIRVALFLLAGSLATGFLFKKRDVSN